MTAVTLRKIIAQDAPLIVNWRNQEHNARWFPKQGKWTVDGHLDWYYKRYLTDPAQNQYLVLADGVPVGMHAVTISDGQGEIERTVLGNKRYAGKGVMSQGISQLMAAYMLPCYWLRVMPDNEACIRLYTRLGFRKFSDDGGPYVNVHGDEGRYLIYARVRAGYNEAPRCRR